MKTGTQNHTISIRLFLYHGRSATGRECSSGLQSWELPSLKQLIEVSIWELPTWSPADQNVHASPWPGQSWSGDASFASVSSMLIGEHHQLGRKNFQRQSRIVLSLVGDEGKENCTPWVGKGKEGITHSEGFGITKALIYIKPSGCNVAHLVGRVLA